MATKKVSGRDITTDVRSGMDCAPLIEKHDLSVAQLKKALGTLAAKGVLSEDELPSWMA